MKTVVETKFTPIWQLAEPDERPKESWVRLFRAGSLVYEGEPIEIDRAELELISTETNRLIANIEKYAAEAGDDRSAWKPPIMSEHKSEGGKTYGSIQRTKVANDELYGLVLWKADTWEQVLAEEVEFISPHVVGGYQDSKGEKYARVLWETSLTTHPKLKDIGRVQDTLSIRLNDKTITLNEQEGEQMEELAKEIMARFDALEAKVDAALGTVEAMDDDEEVEAMDEEIEAGDDEEEYSEDGAPSVDVAAAEAVAELRKMFSERFGKMEQAVAELSKRKATLLTDEPGGDDGKPEGQPSTIEGKIAQFRKQGMSQAEASIAARK
jgi:phage host-nuclease inhibitor protein Gam